MALIKCGECGSTISDQTYTCPHCFRDVRVLKENGAHCCDCKYKHDSCYDSYREIRTWGPNGYVCLAWKYFDWDSD